MPASTFTGEAGATSSSGSEQNNSKPSTMPLQTSLSRLEQLPLELRQQIYTYVFADNVASIDVTVRPRDSEDGPYLKSLAFPTFRSLMLTNHQIATEVRSYFFAFHRFRFVDRDDGDLTLLTTFWRNIGPINISLVRRIALPLYSIGLFGHVDCCVGQTRLRCTSIRLADFPGLTHLDLGVCLAECLPASHELFGLDQTVAEGLERWDWSGPESEFPMRKCFEEVGRAFQNKGVEVNIYWSDLLTQELLPGPNRQVFDTLEATYQESFLVVLQELLNARSVTSKGPLVGFQRVHNDELGAMMTLPTDE